MAGRSTPGEAPSPGVLTPDHAKYSGESQSKGSYANLKRAKCRPRKLFRFDLTLITRPQ
jgi:hypothetical protein